MAPYSSDSTRFMGKVTAGVTHDLQNVLAIIKETAGLLEDILLMNRDAGLPFFEKFNKALGTIKAQSTRGAQLTTTLNQFAHTPDKDEKTPDIYHTVQMLVHLTERKHKTLNVDIHVDKPEIPLKVASKGMALEMALLAAVDALIECYEKDFSIHISVKHLDNAINISFSCSKKAEKEISSAASWPILAQCLSAIKGAPKALKDGLILVITA